MIARYHLLKSLSLLLYHYLLAVAVAVADAQYALPYAMTVLATAVPQAPLE